MALNAGCTSRAAHFRRKIQDQDLEAELGSLSMNGQPEQSRWNAADEARQAALASVGSITSVKESCRDASGLPLDRRSLPGRASRIQGAVQTSGIRYCGDSHARFGSWRQHRDIQLPR
jgi:hypothetical protein